MVSQREKVGQAILYFLHQMGPLEAAHIVALLYFAEFDHFERHRTPLFGLRWIKTPNGFDFVFTEVSQ